SARTIPLSTSTTLTCVIATCDAAREEKTTNSVTPSVAAERMRVTPRESRLSSLRSRRPPSGRATDEGFPRRPPRLMLLGLLSPNRHGRVDPRRPNRREPARRDAHHDHRHRHGDERRRIVRLNAEQQPANEPCPDDRAGNAEEQAVHEKDPTLPEHHALHTRAVGAEAHPDPDLVRARAHREGQHAGNTTRRNDHP